MSKTFWNEKLDFLKAIRTGWCNDDYIELSLTELHRKLYRMELKNGGRDYRFAIKIPVLMQKLDIIASPQNIKEMVTVEYNFKKRSIESSRMM